MSPGHKVRRVVKRPVAAERLVEESKEGRSDGVVTRITFTPTTLARELTLAFTVS